MKSVGRRKKKKIGGRGEKLVVKMRGGTRSEKTRRGGEGDRVCGFSSVPFFM